MLAPRREVGLYRRLALARFAAGPEKGVETAAIGLSSSTIEVDGLAHNLVD